MAAKQPMSSLEMVRMNREFTLFSWSIQSATAPIPMSRAEGIYFTLLGQARSYKVSDGTLTLYDEGGNESLIFSVTDK